MSEHTIINGWNIKQGDYRRDASFDSEMVTAVDRTLRFRNVLFFATGLFVLCSFIAVLVIDKF